MNVINFLSENLNNLIVNIIGVFIGGMITIYVSKKQAKEERKRTIALTARKLHMYFSDVKDILEKIKDKNKKDGLQARIYRKPYLSNLNLNIVEELSILFEYLYETEIDSLLNLYNKINYIYYNI